MPVLITMATINALFRSDNPVATGASFLDPELLRKRCIEVIGETETREHALMLTQELQKLAQRYQTAVGATVDAYLTKSVEWQSSANDLIELMEPLDIQRVQTLQEIVEVRRLMREILTTEQWQRIFH